MYDIVLIQLGPNTPEGSIAKYGKANLSERAIGDRITLKGCEPNLVC